MAHDLQQLFDLVARNSGQPDAWVLRKANACHHLAAERENVSSNLQVAAQVHGIVG
jgi:hypothetical protein